MSEDPGSYGEVKLPFPYPNPNCMHCFCKVIYVAQIPHGACCMCAQRYALIDQQSITASGGR